MMFATLRIVLIIFFRFIGRIFFYLFKKRRRIAIANVNRCYGFLFTDTKKLKQNKSVYIVKKSFATLGNNLADFLLLRFYTKKNIDNYIKVNNFNFLKNSLSKNNGVIFAGAHFGSWELAAHYLALKGYKSLIIYNKFKKPYWLDEKIKNQREYSGNKLILKQNSFLSIYKHLKKGGLTVLLTDQHAFPPDGEKFSLLGQDAWTHTGFAKLSLKTGAIIVPAFIVTESLFKYRIEIFEPIDPQDFYNEKNPVYAMVDKFNKSLESSVVKTPHLWMWQHRRFKEVKDLL